MNPKDKEFQNPIESDEDHSGTRYNCSKCGMESFVSNRYAFYIIESGLCSEHYYEKRKEEVKRGLK
jgi:hypothetical protein